MNEEKRGIKEVEARMLGELAKYTPFSYNDLKEAYSRIHSFDILMIAIDDSAMENISLFSAIARYPKVDIDIGLTGVDIIPKLSFMFREGKRLSARIYLDPKKTKTTELDLEKEETKKCE